ncbi:MAG: NAD(P)/FAD-dependent oxidoreductase [Oscillospiraceae bacterium]
MSEKLDLLIIGGGAAGMYCAACAAEKGLHTAVCEHEKYLGRKLGITGKGRCNVTNNCDRDTVLKNVVRNPRFLYSALSRCSPADVMEFFEDAGVPLKTERGQRVFPVSDRAWDIVAALERRLKKLGVQVIKGNCTRLLFEGRACAGAVISGREVTAAAVVLATGGMSYPATGSDGSGYTLAKQAGHTVVPCQPSLVPLETKERWVSRAAGLDLRNIAMKLLHDGKPVYEDFGELMFMAYGIGGPTVLSASAHIDDITAGEWSVEIDLKPALSDKQLDSRILRDFTERRGMRFADSLRGLLPAQLAPVIAELSCIPADKKVDEVTKEQRRELGRLLKHLTLHVAKFRPIEEAIITRGGVSVKEIDPNTMESRLCKGLYFAGEIIDCDAFTGGFNLQIAFSTAFAAASGVAGY